MFIKLGRLIVQSESYHNKDQKMKPTDRQLDLLLNAYYPDEKDSIPALRKTPERTQEQIDYRHMTKQERRAAYKLWKENR